MDGLISGEGGMLKTGGGLKSGILWYVSNRKNVTYRLIATLAQLQIFTLNFQAKICNCFICNQTVKNR